MSEQVTVSGATASEVYEEIIPQIRSLIADEPDPIANMANVASVLKLAFPKVSWVGFYLLRGSELVLGPFQGKPACVRIKPGKGVCGTSFAERRTVIVPDVNAFPGHIVCDPDARSEIVVPLVHGTACAGVLDVDSHLLNAFDATDQRFLEKVAALVAPSVVKG